MRTTERDGRDERGGADDRRTRKARRTRAALVVAAVDLILDRGLAGTTVEAIAERADVTRRTFSRYFTGREDAALDFVRGDGARINASLRARPAAEPPLVAYRGAVLEWLSERDPPPWHTLPRARRLLALVDSEPTLFAGYERIRLDAQDESIRIITDRLAPDDMRELRAAVTVEAAAGVLSAALRIWARGAHDHDSGAAGLTTLVGRAYDALAGEAAVALSHRTCESRTS